MEQVKRVDRPTTLILDDEVPRVPKRAAFFERALRGDLGEKTRQERLRFAYKHPLSFGMLEPIRAMQPLQDGPVNGGGGNTDFSDPVANARAIKSLSYFLGSDLTGICEGPGLCLVFTSCRRQADRALPQVRRRHVDRPGF